jgi:hypothetical protein
LDPDVIGRCGMAGSVWGVWHNEHVEDSSLLDSAWGFLQRNIDGLW